MINLAKIKQIAKAQKVSLKDLSRKVGITEQGMQSLMKKNSCSLTTLEKIAIELDISPAVFFEGAPQGTITNTGIFQSPSSIQSIGSENTSELVILRERVENLEQIIELYKQQIELLKSRL